MSFAIGEILHERDFKQTKIETKKVISKYEITNPNSARAIKECGNWLEFALKENIITSERKLKLNNANFCRYKYCPMCIKRRQKKLAVNFYKVLKGIEQDMKVRYISVTFTVKNPTLENLRATVQQMNKAFKRMSETVKFKNSIIGYLRATEFVGKDTKEGEAHPHFHCLFVVKTSYFDTKKKLYLKQEDYQEMWRKALRVDYSPSVFVRIIKPKKGTKDSIASAIAETVKYPIKSKDFVDMSIDNFFELTQQTKGLRVVATGGVIKDYLKKLKLQLDSESENEDLINFSKEDEKIWEIIAILRYEFENNNYRLKEIKLPKKDNE